MIFFLTTMDSIQSELVDSVVSMYVHKESQICNILPSFTINANFIETVFNKLTERAENIIVGSSYRALNSCYDLFQSFFDGTVFSVNSSRLKCDCGA